MSIHSGDFALVFPEDYPNRIHQGCAFIDVTEKVQEAVAESGIREGMVAVVSLHTTVGITVNELEEGLLERDVPEILCNVAPQSGAYSHHDYEKRDVQTMHPSGTERDDAPAHIFAMLIGSSVNVLIREGRLRLGQWQSIIVMDFDALRFQKHHGYGDRRSFSFLIQGE